MKIIIAGSRSINDINVVRQAVLLANFKITEIVSGNAFGVDKLGEQYALEHNIRVSTFPAQWNQFGKRAGYMRNEEMGEYADGLIAVWDGVSRGTSHMINIIKGLKKPFYIYPVGK